MLPALPEPAVGELPDEEEELLPVVRPAPADVLLVPVLGLSVLPLDPPERLPIDEPVERVPALALGDWLEVSSDELPLLSWSELDCPHFMADWEPPLFRRDHRKAPAAATAVTAAAAATGRDLALSMTADTPPERWPSAVLRTWVD